MGSPWTDESAIMRDLSFAQRRWVPGGIDNAVAGAKPPVHNITEETEEEYFRHWATDGDFSSGPDLIRIKKMLELIQDQDVPEEELSKAPIQISKLNPAAPMFVTKQKADTKENIKTNKPRRARNVAIASILASVNQLTKPDSGNDHLNVKLAKPEDFIKPKPEDDIKKSEHQHRRRDSDRKVTNWLQSNDITSMFKKKSSVNSLKENNEQIEETGSLPKVNKSPVQAASVKSPQNCGQYMPSSWAKEYYKKAVDRSLMRELVREDVWSRAEKIMKEIDIQKAEALRKQQEEDEALAAAMAAAEARPAPAVEASQSSASKLEASLQCSPEESGISYVLPKSRHDLNSIDHECVVCQVLTVPGQKPNTPDLISDDDEESCEFQPCSDEKTESEGSDESEVNQYFGLVRTSFVENLHESGQLSGYMSGLNIEDTLI